MSRAMSRAMSKPMTNYNERLDKVLDKFGWTCVANGGDGYGLQNEDISEAKQALTSLIKELVAEAKPFDYVPEGHEADACLNHEKYTSACCGCQRQRARNHAVYEFEQNLLKALEEEV